MRKRPPASVECARMRAMDLYFGIALVALLLLALVAARQAYRRRKQRRRPRRTLASTGLGKASARSDMRAYEDTTTLMDAVARTAPPAPPPSPPPARDSATGPKKP